MLLQRIKVSMRYLNVAKFSRQSTNVGARYVERGFSAVFWENKTHPLLTKENSMAVVTKSKDS